MAICNLRKQNWQCILRRLSSYLIVASIERIFFSYGMTIRDFDALDNKTCASLDRYTCIEALSFRIHIHSKHRQTRKT